MKNKLDESIYFILCCMWNVVCICRYSTYICCAPENRVKQATHLAIGRFRQKPFFHCHRCVYLYGIVRFTFSTCMVYDPFNKNFPCTLKMKCIQFCPWNLLSMKCMKWNVCVCFFFKPFLGVRFHYIIINSWLKTTTTAAAEIITNVKQNAYIYTTRISNRIQYS